MKVICKFNDPLRLPVDFPNNFDYGLEVEKEYLVMGMALYRNDNNLHYLVDDNSRPNWFPYQIFIISDNSLPNDWFIKIKENKEQTDIHTIWGFYELCNDERYYDLLIDRDKAALDVYYKYKNHTR